jgi:group I intron endonuclease
VTQGIYKITAPSGSFYIGSSVNIKRRFYQHKSSLKHNKYQGSHFQRAVDKYGVDSFKFETIFSVFDRKDLLHFEQIFIDELKPNLNRSSVAKSPMLDEKIKTKFFESVKKSIKYKNAVTKNQKLAAQAVSKPVVRLTDGMVFESGYQAAKFIGHDKQKDQIYTAIKNGWKFGGHYWKYEGDDVTLDTITANAKQKDAKRKEKASIACANSLGKKVVRISDGSIFPSASEASRQMGLYKTAIYEAIKRGVVKAGSRWQYV